MKRNINICDIRCNGLSLYCLYRILPHNVDRKHEIIDYCYKIFPKWLDSFFYEHFSVIYFCVNQWLIIDLLITTLITLTVRIVKFMQLFISVAKFRSHAWASINFRLSIDLPNDSVSLANCICFDDFIRPNVCGGRINPHCCPGWQQRSSVGLCIVRK